MECPFKKRKIDSENDDSAQASSIALIDEFMSNGNENMPESLNEQNDFEMIEEDEEAAMGGGGGENSGEDLKHPSTN
jgi:hypothetical protein